MSDTFNTFISLVEIIAIPLGAYVINKINQSSSKIDRIEAILIGVDGKNGLRSRIRRLEVKVDGLTIAQGRRHGESITIIEDDHETD
jgi:hypothetical protein